MKPLNPETLKFQLFTPETRSDSIVLVPCRANLETGFFLPLYTVKEMFPYLDVLDPRPTSSPCSESPKGARGGKWTPEEDGMLVDHVATNGPVSWAQCAALLNSSFYSERPVRMGKQCRERWHNHLDPGLNKSGWKVDEDLRLLQLQSQYGKCWSRIAKDLPGRTENSVKNRWNSLVKRGRKDLLLHSESEELIIGKLLDVMKAKTSD